MAKDEKRKAKDVTKGPDAQNKGPVQPAGPERAPGEPPRHGTGAALIGKRVVDAEGLELGFVDEVEGHELKVGEGPMSEWLRIPLSFVGETGDEVKLLEPLQELLKDVEVFDSAGRSIGWATDVIATGDVVDGIIVKSPEDSHFVLLEDLRTIGGVITLDITLERLRELEGERKRKGKGG